LFEDAREAEERKGEPAETRDEEHEEGDHEARAEAEEVAEAAEELLARLLTEYEATTVGGLVSEIAGHIPLPGEVVEDGPLRLEVIASTDRLVERVRVGLTGSLVASEAE
jgi:CBS domain containing-hemolysin-like protein